MNEISFVATFAADAPHHRQPNLLCFYIVIYTRLDTVVFFVYETNVMIKLFRIGSHQ